jgi:hypothetical protein
MNMGTVRISADLKRVVVANAMATYLKRLNMAQGNLKFPYDGPTFYSMLFGEWEKQMEELPKGFFPVRNSIVVRNVSGIVPPTLALSCGMKRFPYDMPSAGRDFVLSMAMRECASVTLLPSERWEPIIKAVHDWKQQHDNLVAERDAFVLGVTKVLDAHATLGAAVKTWPALWELVPENVKERQRSATKPEKKEAAPLDIDVDRMTAAVAMSKIL